MKKKLKEEIEILRQELYTMYNIEKTIDHPRLIHLSQQLDSKINAYQLLNDSKT